MRDFLQDLRDHWDDSYWWADHQWLMAILLGAITLAFKLLEVHLTKRIAGDG